MRLSVIWGLRDTFGDTFLVADRVNFARMNRNRLTHAADISNG